MLQRTCLPYRSMKSCGGVIFGTPQQNTPAS